MNSQIHRVVFQAILLVASTMVQHSAQAQPAAPVRPPIIDVHMHAYAKDERWDHKVGNPITGQPMSATNEQSHMRATFAEMKKYNVVKALVSTDYEAVLRWKSAAPDNVIVSYGFDDPAKVNLEFLRKEHAAGRLLSLGEIGAQYVGLAPNDAKLEPIYALAEELDIPLGIHIGLSKPGVAYDDSPKVALMWAHPQVYVDVGVIDWALPRAEFHAYLRRLVEAGSGDRIMFGSDQIVWPEVIGRAIEGIESASFLTEQQKRDIFYNNAARFLRLDKKI